MNEELSNEMSQLHSMFNLLIASVEELKQGFRDLDEKVDARVHDTRPIWERITGDIDKLRLGQEEIRTELIELRTGQAELRTGLNELRTGHVELRTDLEELRTGHAELRTGQLAIIEELRKINYHLKLIDGKLKSAFGEVGDLRADFTVKMTEIENRLTKLEPPQ